MRLAQVSRRLGRLETITDSGCPACAGRQPVTVREGQEIPTCPICNNPVPVVLVVHDFNFFGNIAKLRQCGALRGE
jgi:hypothetical protein